MYSEPKFLSCNWPPFSASGTEIWKVHLSLLFRVPNDKSNKMNHVEPEPKSTYFQMLKYYVLSVAEISYSAY